MGFATETLIQFDNFLKILSKEVPPDAAYFHHAACFDSLYPNKPLLSPVCESKFMQELCSCILG